MLKLRLIFGVSLAVLLIGLLLIDGWLATLSPPEWDIPGTSFNLGHWIYNGAICTAVIVVFAWLAARELIGFARALGYQPQRGLAILGAVGLVSIPFITSNWSLEGGRPGDTWVMALLVLVLILAFLFQAARYRTEQVMANIASTLFIVLYVGGLGYFMSRLRMDVAGRESITLLLYSLFIVKMTDTGAYVTGRLWGRHKLIEWLSPKKTREGFIGGVLVAVLCALGIGHWLHSSGLAHIDATPIPYPWILVVFGLLMAGFSAAGDLCASLLKREAAIKDSGKALPGLGGIIDVLDSPLLAAPAAWFFWTHVVQIQAV
ncbi:MAG: phosphatidate cytidylyltransferase [Planctomycetota bacterium]